MVARRVVSAIARSRAAQVHEQQEAPEHMDEVCQALLTHSATLASSVCDVVVTSSLEPGALWARLARELSEDAA